MNNVSAGSKLSPGQGGGKVGMFDQLALDVPQHVRILGVDWGRKRIGIAISDMNQIVASGLEVLTRSNFSTDCTTIASLMGNKPDQAWAIVIGFPEMLNGAQGQAAQGVRSNAHRIAAATGCMVLMWDERLSTAAVERVLIEAGCNRRRRSEVIDKAAATYMLQGALDRLATLRTLDRKEIDS